MFIRHARMLMADKGEYVAVREMRKHAGWYFKGLPGVSALRAKVNATQTISALTELVTCFLCEDRASSYRSGPG
jgi:tRNA-dihydrouridine synthase